MSGVLHGVVASLKAAAAAVTDAFFEYVALLLNTNSTNGAQNNTFLDSSTNAFSITRNGNTTQGTFSPFSQTGWSNYFDGAGDYLTTASSGTTAGDFTYEAWVYQTAATTGIVITVGSEAADRTYMYVTSGQQLGWGVYFVADYTLGGTVPLNQWNHIAIVRSGTTVTGYVNGTALGTTTTYSGTAGNANGFAVGAGRSGASPFTGFISNARVVNGTAVYTANFTPPTSPLTAITNTSLLTCQSNRFIDNSSNAFAITRNGDVSVQAFSPFNPTAAWSASANGGSGYFDGTGDYLSVADNVALEPGTGDFCLETWVYFNALTIGNIYNAQQSGPSISLNASNQIEFGQSYVSVLLTDTVAATTGQWYHVAVCRSGTTLSMFVNGSRRATATNSTNFNTTVANYIGWNGVAAYFNGYLSNLRLVKGSAVYDPTLTTLTVPTAPLTAITNTSLLLNFTNAGIFDSASGNDLETVGNAQVSTTQAKWGTTSMAFDGTGDWLIAPDRPPLRFGTGAFTVEGWIYFDGTGSRGIVSKGGTLTGWVLRLTNNPFIAFTFGDGSVDTSISSSVSLTANTWYHVAVVREGTGTNQTKLYVNGVNDGTGTCSINFNQTNSLYIGSNRGTSNPYTGYIDDLRITNGYARYTANFTPPTAAFPLN